MKSKITLRLSREPWNDDINKCRGLEASALIDAGFPVNAGSLLKAGVSRSVF